VSWIWIHKQLQWAHKKLTGTENLTKYTFCLGPVGPTDKENWVKMYKKYRVLF
jgi:hypothetical protein